MHVIPMEHPNRRFPTPPPFVWHPDLFPQLAQNNPEPANFEIPRKQSKPKQPYKDRTVSSKEPAAITVMEGDEAKRFKMPRGYGVRFFTSQRRRYECKSNTYMMKERSFSFKHEAQTLATLLPKKLAERSQPKAQ